MNHELQNAVALDQRGDVFAARTGYQKVLAREPANIDALFLLGRPHCQQGKFEPGAVLLRKVIALAPNFGQDFCGLEWDEACLAFHDVECPVRTASAAQARQPIYRSSTDRWRVYEEQLQPLLEALGQRE